MRQLYVCFKMLKKAEGRVRKGRDLFPVHLLIGTGCRWKAPAELLLGELKKSILDVLSLLLGFDPGGLSTCKWWWPAERLWVVSTFQDLVPSSTNRCTSLHLGKKSICWFLFIYCPLALNIFGANVEVEEDISIWKGISTCGLQCAAVREIGEMIL